MTTTTLEIVNDIFRPIFGYDVFPENDRSSYVEYEHNAVNMPAVKSVIFNKEATIVYFDDGTKCIVRKSDKDEYNREHAVVYAIVKRAYGVVDENGIVQGNGMGSMLEKIVENGYDQEAHVLAEKAKKAAKRNAQRNVDFVGDDDHVKANSKKEVVKPWTTQTTSQNRDNKGRFVKKANRS